jgi:large repetitive protein
MNYTSIKKISLTTFALVAALAVSARANGPVTSAMEHHRSAVPQHSIARTLLPSSVYQIDDGSSENSVGLTLGGDVICLNQYTVIPGSETITSIDIAWGTPSFPDPTLIGLPYTVVLWGDPNNDGNPNDPANVLTTASGVITDQGNDIFLNTAITPTTITGTSFFVGFLIPNTASGQFPASFDQDNPQFNRSYIAGGAAGTGDINNLNNNQLPVAPIESFGLLGNWMIRADAGSGGESIVLAASVRRQQGGNRVVALTWSPADGGANVNILKNGAVLHGPIPDNGTAQDNIRHHTGTFTYQVCETDTGTCSNVVTVVVR